MVHTILSNYGYKIKKHDLSSLEIQNLKRDLTVKPFIMNGFNEVKETRFRLYLESPSNIYIPRFYGFSKFGNPSVNKLSDGDPIDITFHGSLRPEQVPIVDLYMESAKDKGGGLISLKCGGGKTVLALYIIALLQVKTIVVVHKDFLMTQWRDRILEFLPDAKIGKIQQSTIDIEGKDIVLAMVQSLSMKEYDNDIFRSFGFAVYDECHHLGAEVFHKSMMKVSSKYNLGLSATPNRKDGLRKVFEWYIGPMVYMTTDKNSDHIETRIYEFTCDNPSYSKDEILYNGQPCYPRMINNITECQERNQFIYKLILDQHKTGRRILVLSDRRGFLDQAMEWLNQEIHSNVAGLYVGGMKPHELRESQVKDIILGTFSMASEGMDIPALNTILLSSPKSDVVQSVGRILREKADKRKFHPMVIDIDDCHPNLERFGKQCSKRTTYYKSQNHDITLYKLDGTHKKIEKRKKKSKPKEVYEMDCLF